MPCNGSHAGSEDVRSAMQAAVGRQRGEQWRGLIEERMQRLLDRGVGRLDDLIGLALDDRAGVDDRVAACWFLGQLRQPRAMPGLCEALTRGPLPVRLEACYAAVELGDTGATGCLGQALSSDQSAEVRKAAAYALGWLRDRTAVPGLLETLRNSGEDAEVRGMAAEQLGRLEDPHAVSELRQALRDKQPEVRFWAAYALGYFASGEVIDDLKVLADGDTAVVPGHGSVREEALEAINNIRKRDPPARRTHPKT